MKIIYRFLLSLTLSVMLIFNVVPQSGLAATPPDPADAAETANSTGSVKPVLSYPALAQKAAEQGSVRIIATLNVPFQPEGQISGTNAVDTQRATIHSAQASVLARLNSAHFSGLKQYQFQPTLAMAVTPEGLAELEAAPEILSIREDQLSIPTLNESVTLIGARPDQAFGFTGSGWTVAVLDTGVDKTHPMLASKVVSEACYSTNDPLNGSVSVCPGGVESSIATGSGVNCTVASACSHGTHVAGIVAGKSSSLNGVARDANIIAIQVFSYINNALGAWDSDVLLGLERVYELAQSMPVAAVNMSLGGGYYTTTAACDSAFADQKAAIDNLRSLQVATVIASGNESYTNGIAHPGCLSSAISVGSTRDGSSGATPVDTVSTFSNSASFLSLLAPGEWITSSVPGNSTAIYSGTSMATPHVAGAFALMRSAKPTATVDQILAALTSSGKPVTDTRNGITKPRIQVNTALTQLNTELPSISSFSPTSGLIGQTVTINGINLAEATSLKFNTAEAEFKVNSATQIVAIVPYGATTGNITVTTPKGIAYSASTFGVTTAYDNYTLIKASLPALEQSSAAWGDYDNDHNLDLLLSGLENGSPVTKIFRNDGSGAFNELLADLPGVSNGATLWEDDDNDGDLDLLVTGQGSTAALTEIYRNASGSYTAAGAGLTPLSDSAAAWGDYDNDGDADLLTLGKDGPTPKTILYSNNDGVYSPVNAGFLGLYHGSADWGDYDNDGDLDLLLSGTNGTSPSIKIYKNNADGSFSELTHPIPQVSGGAAVWGDYNRDGYLDVLAAGQPASGVYVSIYTYNASYSAFWLAYSSSTAFNEAAAAWVDFDSDGIQDAVIAGNSTTPMITFMRGTTLTSISTNITPVYGGAMAWGDYDQDGDPDLLLTGRSSLGPATFLYRNEHTARNTAPTAPTSLTTSVQPGGMVNLSWGASSDTQTTAASLAYNLRVGMTAGGVEVLAPNSDLSDGFRRLPNYGNVGRGTTAVLKTLPPGDYTWSVQAIDSGMASSPFATEGSFAVPPEIRFGQKTYTVGEEAGSVTLDLILTKAQSSTVTVDYAAASVTAIAGSDYAPTSGQITFEPGQTTASITIPILEDTLSEADETFTINLTNLPAGIGLGNIPQGQVSILDNDGFSDAGITLMPSSGSEYGDISRAWGDFDNDGDLDILSMGTNDIHHTDGTFTYIHRNNGDGTFTNIGSAGLTALDEGYVEWGDYDNDGDLDILHLGVSEYNYQGNTNIYRNNGNNTFTNIHAGLEGFANCNGAWGDYDNDGDLDLAVMGQNITNATVGTRLYRNNGNDTFTDVQANFKNLTKGQLAWGDYDNDNDLDLLITGLPKTDNATSMPYTFIERNNGNGTFSEINPGLDNVAMGSASWGDYDNDGDLDILLTGCVNGTCTTSISKIYRNNSGTFTALNAGLPGANWLKNTYAFPYHNYSSWGDYDNDGDLDILLSGLTAAPSTRVYRNDGGGLFTDTHDNIIQGASGPTAWGDYDNDGDLDLLTISGRIYRNKTLNHNTPPSAPTNLSAATSTSSVTLQWSAARDNQTPSTALSYNLRVGTYTKLENTLAPMANLTTGYRRIPAMGNANLGTSAVLNLPANATYYWGVQAVDSAFAGSPFSVEGSFTTPPPTAQLKSPTQLAAEGQGTLTLEVTLSNASAKTVTLKYETVDGSASGLDYETASGTLTFSPGQTSKTISLTILEDTIDEANETFTLRLIQDSNATLGTIASTVVTITDNDAAPTLGFATSAYNADEDMGSLALGLTLTNPSASSITVTLKTETGTGAGAAMPGQDYTALNQTVTFAPNETSKSVTLPILDDAVEESDEWVNLSLSNPTNAVLGTSSTQVTIHDVEPPVTVQFNPAAVTVSEDAGAGALTVTLSRPTLSTVTVNYQTGGGTATASLDYTVTSGMLTFNPGETSKIISVPVLQDTLEELDETVQLSLSNPSHAVLGAQSSAVLTIHSLSQPDPTAALVSSTVTIAEGQPVVSLEVRLSATSQKTVTVNYQTTNVDATAGADYTSASGTLTFSPGQTSKTITVSLINDLLDENDETFRLTLSNPVNATLTPPSSAQVTIQDDDAAPSVSLAKNAYSLAENQGTLSLGINLNIASAKTVKVRVKTGTGTATAGEDYTALDQVITFNPGVINQVITLPILDDTVEEDDETVNLALSDPVNASLGTPSTSVVTIQDAEPAVTAQFAQAAEDVSESQGEANISVTLSRATRATVTVCYSSSDGSATAGEDYTTTSGKLTFLPGQISQSINLKVLQDDLDEADETVQLTLCKPEGATLGTPNQTMLTILDDDSIDARVVKFTVSNQTATENQHSVSFTVTLSRPAQTTVSVHYQTQDGSATAGEDYVSASGTLTFQPGETSQTITVVLSQDRIDEPDETLRLLLSDPFNAVLGDQTEVELVIQSVNSEFYIYLPMMKK